MADANSKEVRFAGVKRIYGDKTSRKFLYFAGAVSLAAIAYAMYPNSNTNQKPAFSDSVNKVRSNGSAGRHKSGVVASDEYQNLLKQDDNQKIQAARQSGKDAMPSIVLHDKKTDLPMSLENIDAHGSENSSDSNKRKSIISQDNPLPAAPTIHKPVQQHIAPRALDMNVVQAMAQEMNKYKLEYKPAQVVYIYSDKKDDTKTSSSSRSGHGRQSNEMMGENETASEIGKINGMKGPGSKDKDNSSTSVASNDNNGNSLVVGGIDGGPTFKLPATGTVIGARLLGEVNSDKPGPVLGEVEQGAFSGARILGSFQFGEKGVMIKFNSMTIPYQDDNGADQSETVNIDCIAVDHKHLGTAMATSINHHAIERIGAQFGASFLQGLGQAAAQSGSTAYMSPYGGTTVSNSNMSMNQEMMMAIGQGASQAGSVFQEMFGNQRTTIKVAQGTQFGLLFVNGQNNN